MRIVTKEEFLEWIKEQPDDKNFNYDNVKNNTELCGCPMVQFGVDKGVDFYSVGSMSWFPLDSMKDVMRFEPDFSFSSFYFFGDDFNPISAYKQLKQKLKLN